MNSPPGRRRDDRGHIAREDDDASMNSPPGRRRDRDRNSITFCSHFAAPSAGWCRTTVQLSRFGLSWGQDPLREQGFRQFEGYPEIAAHRSLPARRRVTSDDEGIVIARQSAGRTDVPDGVSRRRATRSKLAEHDRIELGLRSGADLRSTMVTAQLLSSISMESHRRRSPNLDEETSTAGSRALRDVEGSSTAA